MRYYDALLVSPQGAIARPVRTVVDKAAGAGW